MVAEKFDFTSMSVDELWSLHEEISAMLSARIQDEKRELEKRLAILNRGADTIRDTAARAPTGKPRRKYPVVVPRYRNPETSETWSGRGKRPRWLVAAMKAGGGMDDFLIGAPPAVEATAKTPKRTGRTPGKGKSSDPFFRQVTAYIPQELHSNATIALRLANQSRVEAAKEDFSELLTRLLAGWYEKQTFYRPGK